MSVHDEGAETRVRRDIGTRPPDSERAVVIRAEEEIADVGTTWRGVGFLRARKHADRIRVDEVLARDVEGVELERVPAEDGDTGGVLHLPDGSLSIPVYEEELVVTKRVVLKERVVIRKEVVTESERLETELLAERVEIEVDQAVADRVYDPEQ